MDYKDPAFFLIKKYSMEQPLSPEQDKVGLHVAGQIWLQGDVSRSCGDMVHLSGYDDIYTKLSISEGHQKLSWRGNILFQSNSLGGQQSNRT